MKNKSLVVLACLLILSKCQQAEQRVPELNLFQIPSSPELFGEHVISTPFYERDIAISPEGDEIIYTMSDYKQSKRCLIRLKKLADNWSAPEILNISGVYQDIEPFFAPSGDRLYFASNRPIYKDSSRHDFNIWFSEKKEANWAEPVALAADINTAGDEFYPSVSRRGTLYFTATRPEGPGREDIYTSTFSDDTFQAPIPLGSAINSERYEFNAYISPDEHLIIFTSYGREDDLGGGDLYISSKNEQGEWNDAKHMGDLINSDKLDYCPFIDWERQNFYFTSERISTIDEKFKTVGDLKAFSNRIANGYGNIYRIGIRELGLP